MLFFCEVPLPPALKIKCLLIPELPAAFLPGCGSLHQGTDLYPCSGIQVAEGSAALTSLEFSLHVFAAVSAEITLAE